jgi:hypothetical protein
MNIHLRLLAFSLILSLSIYSLSLAQDYYDLYKEYLPPQVRNSNELSFMAAENLKVYTSIHPVLIYFYISDLRLWLEKKDTISARVLDRYLSRLKSSYLLERSNWAKDQLKQMKAANLEDGLFYIGESYINDLLDSPISKRIVSANPIPIDSEKLDKIVSLYYQNNKFLNIDSVTNTQKGRVLVEQNIINQYHQLAQSFRFEKNTELYPLSIIDEYKTFWYLFPLTSSAEIDSSYFLPNFLNYRYSNINSASPLSFSFMNVSNHSSTFSYKFHILPTEYYYDIFATSEINQPQYMVQCSYACYLKSVKVPFSKITFSLSYLWSTFTNEKISVDLEAKTNQPTAIFDQRELTMKSLRSIFWGITTPLVYINRSILIECGGLIGLSELQYSFNYQYRYEPDSLTSIKYAFSIDNQVQKQFICMPIIKMTVDLPFSLSLSGYYSFWLYSFGIEYKF